MPRVVSLFDHSGLLGAPFTARGWEALALDNRNWNDQTVAGVKRLQWDADSPKAITFVEALRPEVLIGFPVCTDLAASGNGFIARKQRADPGYLQRAMRFPLLVAAIGEVCQCPWAFENPVGHISRLWRKPDFYFHPWEYGGYLPEADIHPMRPDVFPPRDAYTKRTGIWCGNGFTMPPKRPVPVVALYAQRYDNFLGGARKETKEVRALTPRGFATALAVAFDAQRSEK